MANYAASVLAEAKLILAKRYAAPEKRLKVSGVVGSFLKNSQLAIPNLGTLRASESRAEKGYFMTRQKRAATGTRTFNHTGTVGDSMEVAFTWQTFKDVAQTSLKRAENQLFNDAELLANELDNIFKNIHEEMDATALAYLATNKTAVNTATKNGSWNALNGTWEVASANISRFLQLGKSMLRQNYYKSAFDAILDPVLYVEAEYAAAQGGGNATNYGFQFGGASILEAVDLADANYLAGMGFIIPEGTIGAVDWIPSKNRQGKGDYESVLGGYGTIQDPITGLTFAVHAYSQRADTSASGGNAQDVVTEWEVSVDMSFNHSPNSVATETTLFEVGVV